MLRQILLIVTVLFVVWRILTARGRRMAKESAGADDFSRFSWRSRERRLRQQRQRASELVSCTACGTFIPADRVLLDGNRQPFCSELCREQHDAQAC